MVNVHWKPENASNSYLKTLQDQSTYFYGRKRGTLGVIYLLCSLFTSYAIRFRLDVGFAAAMAERGESAKDIAAAISEKYGAPKNAVKKFLIEKTDREA